MAPDPTFAFVGGSCCPTLDLVIAFRIMIIIYTLTSLFCNVILKREDEVIISRLRIGHSKLTHSYLINKEQQPECISCNCPLSVYHILLECCDFTPIRNTLFNNIQSMHDLFTNTSYHIILRYLKECDLYQKL